MTSKAVLVCVVLGAIAVLSYRHYDAEQHAMFRARVAEQGRIDRYTALGATAALRARGSGEAVDAGADDLEAGAARAERLDDVTMISADLRVTPEDEPGVRGALRALSSVVTTETTSAAELPVVYAREAAAADRVVASVLALDRRFADRERADARFSLMSESVAAALAVLAVFFAALARYAASRSNVVIAVSTSAASVKEHSAAPR